MTLIPRWPLLFAERLQLKHDRRSVASHRSACGVWESKDERSEVRLIRLSAILVVPSPGGAGHLPGLLHDLKASDLAWEIKSLKWERTIDTPETLSGRLT